jgi:hypothetical protein
MKRLAFLILMLPLEANASFLDGNKLHSYCATNKQFVGSYSAGVYDKGDSDYVLLIEGSSEEPARIEYNSKIADRIAGHCAPQKVTLGQIADIVCRHLTAHPETRQMSATDLVTESFVKAFPCGPPNRK